MNASSGGPKSSPVIEVDLADLEVQLHRLADHFVECSRVAGSDAIELFDRGTLLQRAAFALRTARTSDTIDLRDDCR